MTVLGLVSLIVSIVALGVALHAESLVGDAKMCGTRPFTLRDLTRIADFFDVSVDFLLGRSDYAKPLEVA